MKNLILLSLLATACNVSVPLGFPNGEGGAGSSSSSSSTGTDQATTSTGGSECPKILDLTKCDNDTNPCTGDNFCFLEAGVCLPLRAVGSSCLDDEWCASPYTCVSGKCNTATSCSSDVDCGQIGYCDLTYNHCTTKHPNFGACTEDRQCSAGSFCHPEQGTCRAVACDGGYCTANNQCLPGRSCLGDACVPP